MKEAPQRRGDYVKRSFSDEASFELLKVTSERVDYVARSSRNHTAKPDVEVLIRRARRERNREYACPAALESVASANDRRGQIRHARALALGRRRRDSVRPVAAETRRPHSLTRARCRRRVDTRLPFVGPFPKV